MIANPTMQVKSYDMRWFVWTIVFLLSTGVLLTTYITYTNLTDDTANLLDSQAVVKSKNHITKGK